MVRRLLLQIAAPAIHWTPIALGRRCAESMGAGPVQPQDIVILPRFAPAILCGLRKRWTAGCKVQNEWYQALGCGSVLQTQTDVPMSSPSSVSKASEARHSDLMVNLTPVGSQQSTKCRLGLAAFLVP